MPKTLRPFLTLAAAATLATFVAAAPALAQAQAPAQPSAPAQKAPAPASTSIQGDLLTVDPDAKTVTIQPAQGSDQVFKYTDATKVVGGDKGVAGLATMKGSKVTVTFRTEGQDRIATQIEVHPKAGN
jgi:hypothetical protein